MRDLARPYPSCFEMHSFKKSSNNRSTIQGSDPTVVISNTDRRRVTGVKPAGIMTLKCEVIIARIHTLRGTSPRSPCSELSKRF